MYKALKYTYCSMWTKLKRFPFIFSEAFCEQDNLIPYCIDGAKCITRISFYLQVVFQWSIFKNIQSFMLHLTFRQLVILGSHVAQW